MSDSPSTGTFVGVVDNSPMRAVVAVLLTIPPLSWAADSSQRIRADHHSEINRDFKRRGQFRLYVNDGFLLEKDHLDRGTGHQVCF